MLVALPVLLSDAFAASDFGHGHYVITSLGDGSADNANGCIGIFNEETDELTSVLEIDKLLGVDGYDHPHHCVWLPNGDLAMCTWGTARIAYWRRLGS